MRAVSDLNFHHGVKDVCDQVVEDADAAIVRHRDAPEAVVMSQAEHDGMQETLHLLSSPRNAQRLLASIAEINLGKARVAPLR